LGHAHSIINEPSKLLIRKELGAVAQAFLPSFLPSICRAPALARVSGRLSKKAPFEIYRHLSVPAMIAGGIKARPRGSEMPHKNSSPSNDTTNCLS
jgi:hypothetical protein